MTMIDAKLGMKVIEKTVTESAKQTSGPSQGESPFKEVMDSMYAGEDMLSGLGLDNNDLGLPGNNMQAISADGINVDNANLRTGLDDPSGMDRVVDMLSEVNDGQMQMESLVNQILHSEKRFSNQELLAIQAHVFHFAQITELVVKAADQGVSSLKTVMNTNIQ